MLQAFVFMVSRKVEALDDCVTKMEKDMDPGRLRKMFTSLPGVFSVSGKMLSFTLCIINCPVCSVRLRTRSQSNQRLNGRDQKCSTPVIILVHKVEQKYRLAQIQDS